MQDIRLAFRALRATPVVSLVAVLSLALGIGANTAIFSLVNSLILRALPVKEPGQLVMLSDEPGARVANTAASRRGPIPSGNRSASAATSSTACLPGARRGSTWRAGGETQFVDGIWASGRMFDTLGVPAMLGRTFTEADDRTRRRAGRTGRGHQLQLLAAAIRRRRRRHRTAR